MNFKQLTVLSITPFLLWGCFGQKEKQKTENQLLKEVSQYIVDPIKKSTDEYINFLPVKYKTTSNFDIEVLNTPEHLKQEVGININNAKLSLSTKGESDESDFSKYASKKTLKIKTSGSVVDQTKTETTWNAESVGMMRIVDDAFWFYLTKAMAESSMLPLAVIAPSTVTNQWYTVSFEKIDEVLNNYLSTSGLEDVKTFSILQQIEKNSLNGLKTNLQVLRSIMDGPPLFRLADQPLPGAEPIPATLTEDGKYYEINIELDKTRVKNIVERIGKMLSEEQISLTGKLNFELKDEDIGELVGKLTVDKTDSTYFKFEGSWN